MTTDCRLCGGGCDGADLGPLIDPALRWLWDQLAAAADRRGDPELTGGPTVLVRAPQDAEQRAAAVGLLGGPLSAGQRRAVPLDRLTERVRRRGPALTPGAVAAHATGRPLAVRAQRQAALAERERLLVERLTEHLAVGAGPVRDEPTGVASAFARSRAASTIRDWTNADQLLEAAVRVLRALPEGDARVDRRLLANTVLTGPHDLDDDQPVAWVVRALLAAGGLIAVGARARDAWAAVGVDGDELTGGLVALGIHPAGWRLPLGAIATLPPAELAGCRWPAPAKPGTGVFVTENPSVLTAARRLVTTNTPVRMLCTSGTPSTLEATAIGRLHDAGWQVTVRADFDEAGLKHVTGLLAAAPSATPWRMTSADYLAAVDHLSDLRLRRPDQLHTPWEPALADAMRRTGIPAFEEALLPTLLDDLRNGHTGQP
jgi:uncharacterized protein (TIGR02679 family)